MLYLHKRTGVVYRYIIEAFDVRTQEDMVVYMSLDTGQVFTREKQKFAENFSFIEDCQGTIVPRDINQTELEV